MSAEPLPILSPQEYLALERAAETRSEYYGGQMHAIYGGTEPHTLLAGNFQLRPASKADGMLRRP